MAKQRSIRVSGTKGKRYTRFPFFQTDRGKKEILYSRMAFKLKQKKRQETLENQDISE